MALPLCCNPEETKAESAFVDCSSGSLCTRRNIQTTFVNLYLLMLALAIAFADYCKD